MAKFWYSFELTHFIKESDWVLKIWKFFGLDLTGSNAWLDRFKASHSISFVNIFGKAKSVDRNAKSDWVTESLTTGQSSEHHIQAKTYKIMIKLDCFTNPRVKLNSLKMKSVLVESFPGWPAQDYKKIHA